VKHAVESDSVQAFRRGGQAGAQEKQYQKLAARMIRTRTSPSCCDLGADSPAESGNECQHAGVEANVQLEKKGEGISTGEACQMGVLLRRYFALLLPLL
jgi:hypothetical protein